MTDDERIADLRRQREAPLRTIRAIEGGRTDSEPGANGRQVDVTADVLAEARAALAELDQAMAESQ
jgi:hypothetical protein